MQLILKNKQIIIKIFHLIQLGLVLAWLLGILLINQSSTMLINIYETGLTIGKIAMVFYCLTLVPGILQRFNILTPVRVVMMTFRRQLGILTFLLVWLHMSWGTLLPLTSFYGYTLEVTSYFTASQWFGLSALALLIPMFLTSNDYSVKRLGPYWKKIHRLTYIIMFLIFMHVALIESKWLLLITPTILAWIFSWLTYLTRKVSVQLPTDNQVN